LCNLSFEKDPWENLCRKLVNYRRRNVSDLISNDCFLNFLNKQKIHIHVSCHFGCCIWTWLLGATMLIVIVMCSKSLCLRHMSHIQYLIIWLLIAFHWISVLLVDVTRFSLTIFFSNVLEYYYSNVMLTTFTLQSKFLLIDWSL